MKTVEARVFLVEDAEPMDRLAWARKFMRVVVELAREDRERRNMDAPLPHAGDDAA
ncbi:MAG: hypothetical protein AB7I13_00125 [Vicinamibacterales bacterium]